MKRTKYFFILFAVVLLSASSAHGAYLSQGFSACISNLLINIAIGLAMIISIWLIYRISQACSSETLRKPALFFREFAIVAVIVLWGFASLHTHYNISGKTIDYQTFWIFAIVFCIIMSVLIGLRLRRLK